MHAKSSLLNSEEALLTGWLTGMLAVCSGTAAVVTAFRPSLRSLPDMKRSKGVAAASASVVSMGMLVARETEGSRTNSVLLNGPWEFCVGTGNEAAESAAGQRGLQWKPVMLPGPFMSWNQEVANQTRTLRARRTFEVPPDQAQDLAVLRWNRVAIGAEAFINGRKVGEHGTLFLAEFPVLFNYQDYRFTPEEWEIWHRNCLLDAAGWMARLWNHPSVIMWVLSNESRDDNAWEEGPFQEFVNRLDPTRPSMRTGTTGTRENLDIHACGNVTETDEGNLQRNLPYWFAEEHKRTTTVSEYMNYVGHPFTQWSGVDDARANALAVAQIGAEHTEAMRRAWLDGIWPCMYAGWTRTRLAARVRERGEGSAVWKADFAAPESAAWHSSLSPVLASLDLFDPNYRPGQRISTDLHLINDSWRAAEVDLDLLLTLVGAPADVSRGPQ